MTYKPFDVDSNVKENVLVRFGKTHEMLKEDVEKIKTWIKTQRHLPEVMGDAKIRNFLILNHWNIEDTKQRIENYYTVRSLIPELFTNCNPKLPNIKQLKETTYMCTHPKLIDGKYRVILFKAKKPDQLIPYNFAKNFFNIQEIRLSEDYMQGDILIFDAGGWSVKDISAVTVDYLANCFIVIDKVYSSSSLQAVYYINSPSYMTLLVTRLKEVLQSDFEKVKVCQDDSVLKEFFTNDELPKDYGGNGPSLEELDAMIENKLNESQERFDELDKLRVNENLRDSKTGEKENFGQHAENVTELQNVL